MGFFSMDFVLSGLYTAVRTLHEIHHESRRDGTTTGLGSRLMSFDEFNALIGVERRDQDGGRSER